MAIDQKAKHNMKYRYNLTPENWNQMMETQEGRCAICKVHQKNVKKTFCVDHDHKTGQVRSLLCGKCNSALGFFHDDIVIVKAAKQYLEDWNQ